MAALKSYEDPKVFRENRKRLGLTQQKLAKKSGVDRTIIANIESGRRKLTGDVADLLWDVLTRTSLLRRRELLTPEQRAAERAKLKLSKEEYGAFSRTVVQILSQRDAELEQKYQSLLAKHEGQLEGLQRAHATTLDDPSVKEVIESFRREIAELQKRIAELQQNSQKPLNIRLLSKVRSGEQITKADLAGMLAQMR